MIEALVKKTGMSDDGCKYLATYHADRDISLQTIRLVSKTISTLLMSSLGHAIARMYHKQQ